jgi:pimeloyl-ACP methyl ester carboxylesterase
MLVCVFTPILTGSEINILDSSVNPDGTVRIRFEDTGPPMPYSLEKMDLDAHESPWKPLGWLSVDCIQPAQFEVIAQSSLLGSNYYRVSVASGWGQPLLIATDPANGATGVSTGRETLQLTFDRPMKGTASVAADSNWGASFVTWSTDRRVATVHRLSYPADLPGQSSLQFGLNLNGSGFSDTSGSPLAPCSLTFTTGSSAIAGPHVISSFPLSGATDADPHLQTVEFHFNKPMMPVGGFTSSGWWPWTLTWSADGRTAYVSRGTTNPLYGHKVMLKPFMFKSLDGTPLEDGFTLNFTTASPPYERIEANPSKGFSWPYYLLIPPEITAPGTLLVEPNNTGTWGDDPWLHEKAALELLNWRSSFAVELGCPLLVPVFPRPQNPAAPEPGGIYVHALDRYSLSDEWAGIAHIDRQMEAMISDALQRLLGMGHAMDDRVFMMGFSASGAFTSRFAILYPERLKAAAAGSPGGWPCAPVDNWQGTPLPYPMGIGRLQELSGHAFDLSAYRQVALYIYVGGSDTNDALDLRGISSADTSLIHAMLNYPADPILANRWPLAESIFNSVNADATFVVYPGIAHTITTDMFDDLLQFFAAHR